MAKYIRTKDKIYEIESDYLNNKGVRVGYNVVGQEEVVLIRNNNIIQADTIEELCDMFVYVDTKHNILKYKYMIRNSLCDNDMKYMKMGTEIYGAIWTSKGLIYVAKMNEKGELELI